MKSQGCSQKMRLSTSHGSASTRIPDAPNSSNHILPSAINRKECAPSTRPISSALSSRWWTDDFDVAVWMLHLLRKVLCLELCELLELLELDTPNKKKPHIRFNQHSRIWQVPVYKARIVGLGFYSKNKPRDLLSTSSSSPESDNYGVSEACEFELRKCKKISRPASSSSSANKSFVKMPDTHQTP